jgi:hypothetical protein
MDNIKGTFVLVKFFDLSFLSSSRFIIFIDLFWFEANLLKFNKKHKIMLNLNLLNIDDIFILFEKQWVDEIIEFLTDEKLVTNMFKKLKGLMIGTD